MINPRIALEQRVAAVLVDSLGCNASADTPLNTATHRSAHADYQCDAAMMLARHLKRNPRDVGTAIATQLVRDDVIASAAVSGPGFVNITLRDGYLRQALAQMRDDARLGFEQSPAAQTVIIDYSAPNLAKEMHVGHLRSTIIGDALSRLLEFAGHCVIRQNHIGDWGTPFGMLIEHMLDQRTAGHDAGVRELSNFYRSAREKFDAEPAFAARARRRVVALQSGDTDTLALWQQLIEVTLEHLAALYTALDVTLSAGDVAGESRYNTALGAVVEELEQLGLARVSDGAMCVFPPGFAGRDGEPLPLIVRKQDGGSGYAVTDLAAVVHRLRVLCADRVLYVVGAPQQQHLAMVFATARIAGWVDDDGILEHIAFGSVLGQDKKMLKTRAGESISLAALLDESVSRAREQVDAKSPQLDAAQRASIARAVGIGAVKYQDMVNDRIKDYVFDWDRMLAFDGNTAPYLMYAHARLESVLRKAGDTDDGGATIELDAPAERGLAMELVHFASSVQHTIDTRQPHHLCRYLHELASASTRFYEQCPVLNAEPPARASRLALCRLSAAVIAKGLDLLGIRAPSTM